MGDCQTRQSNHDVEEVPRSEGEVVATPSSLSIFHEDILLAILSFVADTPFEMIDGGKWKLLYSS